MTPSGALKEFLGSSRLAHQLVRGGLGSMALKASGAALHLGIAVLLARTLSVAEFGIYHYVLSFVALLSIPAHAGIPTLLVRLTATYHALTQWDLLRGLWRRCAQFLMLVSIAVAGLALLAHVAVPALELGDPAVRTSLLIALAAVPINSLVDGRSAALRGLGRVVAGQAPELLIRPLALLALIGAVVLTAPFELSASWAMACNLLASLLALAVALQLLGAVRPPELRLAAPRYETRVWLASIVPLSMLAGAQVLLQQTDAVMLGWMAGYESVAAYRVASQGSAIVGFALLVATTVLSPHIARMYALEDRHRAQTMITVAARVVFASALVVTLAFVAFGELFLRVAFGASYVDAYWILVILCVGLLIKAAAGPGGAVLTMTGNERDAFLGVATATAANIVLNLILIPRHGALGAAIASALAFAVWSVQVTRLAYRKTGFDTTVVGAWRRRRPSNTDRPAHPDQSRPDSDR